MLLHGREVVRGGLLGHDALLIESREATGRDHATEDGDQTAGQGEHAQHEAELLQDPGIRCAHVRRVFHVIKVSIAGDRDHHPLSAGVIGLLLRKIEGGGGNCPAPPLTRLLSEQAEPDAPEQDDELLHPAVDEEYRTIQRAGRVDGEALQRTENRGDPPDDEVDQVNRGETQAG